MEIKISKRMSDLLERSREMRLERESHFHPGNRLQKLLGSGFTGWVVRTVIQSLPFPGTLYGIGDVVTGVSAIIKRDILTGRPLDNIDRIIYTIATAIPGLPATVLVGPMDGLRRGVEDANHASRERDLEGMNEKALLLRDRVIKLGEIIRDTFRKTSSNNSLQRNRE